MSNGTDALLVALIEKERQVQHLMSQAAKFSRQSRQLAEAIVLHFEHIFGDAAVGMIESAPGVLDALETICNEHFDDMDRWHKWLRQGDI